MEQNNIDKKLIIGVRALIIKDDKILLVRQTNKVGRVIYLLPGGGAHPNEDISSAVIREIKEETELDIKPKDVYYIREMISFSKITYDFIFLSDVVGGELKLGYDPEQIGLEPKLKGVEFYPLNELERIEFYPEQLKTRLWLDYKSNWKDAKIFLEKEVFK